MSQQFSAELLPHDVEAGDTLYVTDRVLNVVYFNEEWASFARQNKGTDLLADGWNSSLLENLSGMQKQRWQEIYRLLCECRMPHHEEVMNCSSPSERRMYQLRITPIKDEAGDVVWLVHHNVRTGNVEGVVGRLGGALGRLDGRQALSDEFRVRIVERRLRIPRFKIARYFEPLDEIGGDLVWHREYPGGVSDLIHADVMGHGAEAGLVAAKLAVVLDELGSVELSPSGTVAGLNRAMRRVVPDDEVVFATGLCIRFDRRLDDVVFCNFGGERPIFSQSGQVRLRGGFPVGLAERLDKWVDTPLTLSEHGSRFLIFSDGITEQFNADGSMFGADGLQRAFEKRLAVPLDEMVDMIVEELEQFRGDALVKDDQTLLAVDFIGDA
jgi:hypothetical protein